jgi:hypothetical protein
MTVMRSIRRCFLASLVVLAGAPPAMAAGAGPLFTPLGSFTDGKTAKYVWTVPGALKKNGFVTEFICTSLEFPGTVSDIGVEVFDNTGTQLNNISAAPAPGACNGAVLNVPSGSTVTVATGGTVQLHEDCILGIGAFDNGSARIVSSGSHIVCSALLIDSKNVVVDPNSGTTTGISPSAVSLKVIKRNKQSGD